MSEQVMNIHQKLVEVRKSIGGFHKDSKSYGYSYVSGAQVLSKIQDKMNELGVLLIPSIQEQNFEKHEYVNAKGKSCLDFLVYGAMTYKWVNADKPEDFIEVPFFYTGAQDDISKAFGSGLTYSERYFIIKFFNLPTDADDPDARDTSGNSPKGSNYNNQQGSPQQYTNNSKVQMPTNAKEAGAMTIGFGKHSGKTLKQIWKEDMPYINWLANGEKTDPAIKEGIGMMQVAAAQQKEQ